LAAAAFFLQLEKRALTMHDTLMQQAKAVAEVTGETVGAAYRKLKQHAEKTGDAVPEPEPRKINGPISWKASDFYRRIEAEMSRGMKYSDALRKCRRMDPDGFEATLDACNR
jgi:hypothetical protein